MRQNKQAAQQGAFSILTLDDDPIMTSTIQAYFQRSGYHVDVENDPNQAIERIRTGHYDILLLDFLMSPICGDQVVEQVRQFNQDIFIILLTGHKSMAPPIKTIRALDIQGYYEKSDRFDQLELLVESCAKSIRQMRTIQNYKDGLSSILDSMPAIHSLQSMDSIAGSVLKTAYSLLPCASAVLLLDESRSRPSGGGGPQRFVVRAIGESFTPVSNEQAAGLLDTLAGRPSLVTDRQMVLPLLDSAQQPLGLLVMELRDPPGYGQVQLMEIFARQASSALSNFFLHGLLQSKNAELDLAYRQLRDSYMEVVSAMRRVVDAKDIYTRGHSDRVSYYAVAIARRLGLDSAACEQVRIAGLFHDVGKLSIPDEILLKNGKLTDEEYELIKAHPRNGVGILSALSQFRPILPGVLSHHERFDGRGYPDGLRGTDIPEMARIIAVADAFDAMTTDRQYRKSLGIPRAIDELVRCRGTQFDPQAVDAFLPLVRDPLFWEQMHQAMDPLTYPPLSPDAQS